MSVEERPDQGRHGPELLQHQEAWRVRRQPSRHAPRGKAHIRPPASPHIHRSLLARSSCAPQVCHGTAGLRSASSTIQRLSSASGKEQESVTNADSTASSRSTACVKTYADSRSRTPQHQVGDKPVPANNSSIRGQPLRAPCACITGYRSAHGPGRARGQAPRRVPVRTPTCQILRPCVDCRLDRRRCDVAIPKPDLKRRCLLCEDGRFRTFGTVSDL